MKKVNISYENCIIIQSSFRNLFFKKIKQLLDLKIINLSIIVYATNYKRKNKKIDKYRKFSSELYTKKRKNFWKVNRL